MKTLKQKIAAAAAGLAALGAVQAFTTPAEAQVGVVVGAPGPSPYFWGGRNYCWYGGGWHGPGFYWCGYAWRRGWGWGGPAGTAAGVVATTVDGMAGGMAATTAAATGITEFPVQGTDLGAGAIRRPFSCSRCRSTRQEPEPWSLSLC